MAALLEKSKYTEKVILVYHDALTGRVVRIIEADPNIVTHAGDKYYAKRGAGSTAFTSVGTFQTGRLVVAKSMTVTGAAKKSATFGNFIGVTASYTGRKTFESGYPKTADTDTNNTARTVDGITYKAIYGTAAANYTIGAVGISRPAGATNSNGALLSAKTLPPGSKVLKTSSLTLTVYITHVFNGVP
jgi:hypothetical protein